MNDAPQNDRGATLRRHASGWSTGAGIVLVLLLAYVGSYFVVLALPESWRLPSHSAALKTRLQALESYLSAVPLAGAWQAPDYHGIPDWFYAPLHEVDRKWLRPGHWRSTPPKPMGSVRFYDDFVSDASPPAKAAGR